MLELQDFINENQNYKELLSEDPYNIKIMEDENFLLFKYNQIKSDFNNSLVRECRGIILDKSDHSVVCHPFHKFGNFGESYVPEIDWKSAKVQEKVDGSLIKIYWNKYLNKWQVATNGTIDARNAGLQETPLSVKYPPLGNFYALVLFTLANMKISYYELTDSFDKDYTYLFELCTPLNRIVVKHTDFILYHLSTKNNLTGGEIDIDLGLPKPDVYSLSSLDECIATAEKLPFSEEGYVVVDKDLNRLKVKNPSYVVVHHLKGEEITKKSILKLIMLGEKEEFLNYFDEYKEVFEKFEIQYNRFLNKMNDEISEARNKKNLVRKDFALWATKQTFPSILFGVYDDKIFTVEQGVKTIKKTDSILKIMGNLDV